MQETQDRVLKFDPWVGKIPGEGNGTPLQYSCLENPMNGGAWWAAVHGVTKSRTWLSDFTFTFHSHALEKEMATHSSVLAWRIPGMGEPGGVPSMGSHRVGHDWSDLAAAAGRRGQGRCVSRLLWKEAWRRVLRSRAPTRRPCWHVGCRAKGSHLRLWYVYLEFPLYGHATLGKDLIPPAFIFSSIKQG